MSAYLLGYQLGLQAHKPCKETLGHRIALFGDRVRRYIKNWRHHLLRQQKPLTPEQLTAIQEMARGYEDGLKGRVVG